MRWVAAAVLLLTLTACRGEAPVSDLDDVESTLNSIESDINQPG
ncbi:hypothetical protein SAMN04488564_107376 [Lentzea waywayandensis]|uniref:Uncharacterized protein n=1 Tax=Lentzea waywayandensis TaxID=84724 RepID=A0A1I6F2Q8_9PSEU|nr:hypothetical protein [Lentzea waywayandensis]SFR24259.1 hypothetical protein SAMN04488564_107376 [Lentzea waywayandensis]